MSRIIYVLFLIFCFSCVLTEESYSDKKLFCKLDSKYEIFIDAGNLKRTKHISPFDIYELNFYKVRGGNTILFGNKIREVANGYKEKRLTIRENGIVKAKYSINNLLLMKTIKIDTMTVYLIPD